MKDDRLAQKCRDLADEMTARVAMAMLEPAGMSYQDRSEFERLKHADVEQGKRIAELLAERDAQAAIVQTAREWAAATCESRGYCDQCNDYCGDCISPGHETNCPVYVAEERLRAAVRGAEHHEPVTAIAPDGTGTHGVGWSGDNPSPADPQPGPRIELAYNAPLAIFSFVTPCHREVVLRHCDNESQDIEMTPDEAERVAERLRAAAAEARSAV